MQKQSIDVLQVYHYNTLIIQIVHQGNFLEKRGCELLLCQTICVIPLYRRYKTSENAPHLPSVYYPVVDNLDSNADVQVSVSVSGICLSQSPTNDS